MSVDIDVALERFKKEADPLIAPQNPVVPQKPDMPKSIPGKPGVEPEVKKVPAPMKEMPGKPKPKGDVVGEVVKILEDAIKKIKALSGKPEIPPMGKPAGPEVKPEMGPKEKPDISPVEKTEKPEEGIEQKESSYAINSRIRFKNDVPNLNIIGNTIASVSAIEDDGSIQIQVPDGRIFRIEMKEFGEIEKVEAQKDAWGEKYKDIDPLKPAST